MDCIVWRKQVNRTAPEIAGAPTLGGMFVMDSEDEHDYEYEELGEGRIKILQVFQTEGGNFQDGDQSLLYAGSQIEALIEPVADISSDDYFQADKHDLVTVDLGAGVIQTYQIVGLTGNVNIPPFTVRFVLNPRQDENVGI
jgi:hypothetical protein